MVVWRQGSNRAAQAAAVGSVGDTRGCKCASLVIMLSQQFCPQSGGRRHTAAELGAWLAHCAGSLAHCAATEPSPVLVKIPMPSLSALFGRLLEQSCACCLP